MKSCKGCKHIILARSLCAVNQIVETDKYTGERWLTHRLHVTEARAEGGVCGPDATLYELPWSFWKWVFRKKQG